MSENNKLKRVGVLDEWRGFAISLMVLYHAGFDLMEIFGVNIPFFFSPGMKFLQTLIAGSFILLSGIVCRFSRNNMKRGFFVFLCGLFMTLVTFLFMPDMLIAFGILHLLGLSMMIFALFSPVLDKITPKYGIILTLLLFLLLFGLPNGYLGLPHLLNYSLPMSFYRFNYLFFLGLPTADFFSSDYFPLFPWLFLFILGSFLGIYFKNGQIPAWFYPVKLPFLAKIGRHTLIIYFLHQPILLAIFWVLFSIF